MRNSATVLGAAASKVARNWYGPAVMRTVFDSVILICCRLNNFMRFQNFDRPHIKLLMPECITELLTQIVGHNLAPPDIISSRPSGRRLWPAHTNAPYLCRVIDGLY